MKRLTIACTLSLASSVIAAATNGFTASDAGIVTPDIAVGMRGFQYFNNDTAGNMVVCFDEQKTRNGCERWTSLKSAVPAGRVYVGFRIVSREHGYRQLEVYWK